jgi:hypothetical protein
VPRRAGRVVCGEDREAAPEEWVLWIGNLYLLGENRLICVIEWSIDLMGLRTLPGTRRWRSLPPLDRQSGADARGVRS